MRPQQAVHSASGDQLQPGVLRWCGPRTRCGWEVPAGLETQPECSEQLQDAMNVAHCVAGELPPPPPAAAASCQRGPCRRRPGSVPTPTTAGGVRPQPEDRHRQANRRCGGRALDVQPRLAHAAQPAVGRQVGEQRSIAACYDSPSRFHPYCLRSRTTKPAHAACLSTLRPQDLPVANAQPEDIQDLLGGALFKALFKWMEESGPVYLLPTGAAAAPLWPPVHVCVVVAEGGRQTAPSLACCPQPAAHTQAPCPASW